MSPFEYLLPLISVLVGLAVADLATSLHRLLRARRRVRWDWLPLAAAFLAALTIVNLWWGFYTFQEGTFYRTFAGFLPFGAQLVVLFLLNAAALPDAVPAEGVDLRAFYAANGRYFWSLYAAYILLIVASRAAGYVGGGLPEGIDGGTVALDFVPNLVLLALFAALALVRRRGFHAVAVVALLAAFLVEWSGMRLGAP